MLTRSWIAVLLMLTYLFVVGMGGVNRPEDPQQLVLVQTSVEGQFYQECRYMRMDGLELFMAEALASRYQDGPAMARQQTYAVVSGIATHCLAPLFSWSMQPLVLATVTPTSWYELGVVTGINPPVDVPPWKQ